MSISHKVWKKNQRRIKNAGLFSFHSAKKKKKKKEVRAIPLGISFVVEAETLG